MRPGWIRATPLRNAGKGKRLLVLLSSIVVNLGDSSVRIQGRRPVIIHGSCKIKNTKRYENLEEKEKQ